MENVKANTLFNYGGRGFQVILPLLVTPFYIKLLDTEEFALLMLTASIQAAISIFDLGMGGTLTRELAKLDRNNSSSMDKGVRTFFLIEYAYFAAYTAILLLSYPVAHAISNHWLNIETITRGDATTALLLAIISSCSLWLGNLYSCGLNGLQKMKAINIISININILKYVGGVFILFSFDVGIKGVLGYYFLCHTAQALILRRVLTLRIFTEIPVARTRPTLILINELIPYSAKLSLSTILSVIISQMDKMILSGVLSLTHFGYYTLAATVAQSLYVISAPIGDAVYPRLMQLRSLNMNGEYQSLYRSALIVTVFATALFASIISFNSHEILLSWTKNSEASGYAESILTVLVIGVALNIVVSSLDMVQMTYGSLRPMISARIFLLAVGCPSIWLTAKLYGGYGASIAWMCSYLFILTFVPFMVVRNLTKGLVIHWYRDWVPFALIIIISVKLTELLIRVTHSDLNLLETMALQAMGALIVSMLVFPSFRNLILRLLGR